MSAAQPAPTPAIETPPVQYYPGYLDPATAQQLFNHCLTLDWQQNEISFYGQTRPVPRWETLYGDDGVSYTYSGQITMHAHPWTPPLKDLCDRLATEFGYRYQYVMLTLYRDGYDKNGWHADDEKSLGFSPAIASISLGATRKFLMKPKVGKSKSIPFELADGDLLLMLPGCQEHWQHTLTRTKRPVNRRINLTFRPCQHY